MSPKSDSVKSRSGAELRAQRAALDAARVDPAVEAKRRERSMLDSFVNATRDLEWLGAHEGWKFLGFNTCAEWWGARVQPVVEALGLAPTRELGQRVIALIRAEEASLPRSQQRSAKELAALVGVGEWIARGRQDQRQRRSTAGSDLDGLTTADSFACEGCGAKLDAGIVRAAQTRCLKCDPDRLHYATERGGPCEPCAAADLETAAMVGESVGAGISFDAPPASIGAGIPAPAAPAMVGLCPSPVDPNLCAGGCGTPISWPDRSGGNLRCSTCDPSTMHRAIPHGPGWLPECEYCTSKTATGTVDAAPVDAGDADLAPAAPTGNGLPSSPVGVTPQDLDEGEAVEPPADSPAAPIDTLPVGAPPASEQLGQYSPPDVGSEGFPRRAETDHHQADGGEAPATSLAVEPEELEDGGDGPATTASPSSSDALMAAFGALVLHLQTVDVEAVAPQIFDDEVELLLQHADDVTDFVARLVKARLP